eukprot:GHUV01040390.1.p1 GENE.GHUV01040390.1~~GHUV01040390.1.p1  ORF type:complete len:147 (+),score=27.94 GHUV01040390.1:326-766(+)
MASRQEDCCGWAYSSDKGADLVSSTALIAKRPTAIEQQTTDALTGLIISSPTKKMRTMSEGFEANAKLAGYSPELTKALRSVVKIFTTMARYVSASAHSCTATQLYTVCGACFYLIAEVGWSDDRINVSCSTRMERQLLLQLYVAL